ncbi:Nodulin-like protein [Raphanus sativus]|nr:Nodulin-like protein [Raphanus sativus]
MQEDDEFGEEESNICFKNQEILVATIWIQAFIGTNFDFSTYSSDLKSVLGIHWLWCPVDKLLSPSPRLARKGERGSEAVNKTEEQIWKHINGRRFLNKLEEKEREKEQQDNFFVYYKLYHLLPRRFDGRRSQKLETVKELNKEKARYPRLANLHLFLRMIYGGRLQAWS